MRICSEKESVPGGKGFHSGTYLANGLLFGNGRSGTRDGTVSRHVGNNRTVMVLRRLQ